jgi:hypothetical protein
VATRFYCQMNTLDSPISPAVDAGWEVSAGIGRALMRTQGQARLNITLGTKTKAGSGVSGQDSTAWQLVSFPLYAQTISGTVSGIFRCNETNLTDNYNASFAARVFSADGLTSRGTLLTVYGGGTELPTATATILFPAGSPATLTPVDAQLGDRIVIEVGFNQTSTSVANMGIVFGDSAATDYALTEGLTTLLNPWIEFSQDISFVVLPQFKFNPIPFMK